MSNVELNRRFLIAGLGAAIVAKALPIPPTKVYGFTTPGANFLQPLSPQYGPLTMDKLLEYIRDLSKQVEELAPLRLTQSERDQVALEIDQALWEIKPPSLQILVKASLEDIAQGSFIITEDAPGTVTIR